MKKHFILLCFLFLSFRGLGQQWLVVDIVEQTTSKIIYREDRGTAIEVLEDKKNPSIVNLISKYQEEGFQLFKITQGVELELNGGFPINSNRANNFGFTNINLSNNNRVMLWFRKG